MNWLCICIAFQLGMQGGKQLWVVLFILLFAMRVSYMRTGSTKKIKKIWKWYLIYFIDLEILITSKYHFSAPQKDATAKAAGASYMLSQGTIYTHAQRKNSLLGVDYPIIRFDIEVSSCSCSLSAPTGEKPMLVTNTDFAFKPASIFSAWLIYLWEICNWSYWMSELIAYDEE